MSTTALFVVSKDWKQILHVCQVCLDNGILFSKKKKKKNYY